MARKKITIDSELQGLDDAWGGLNESDKEQTIYNTPVPAGREWGVTRGRVEDFLKRFLSKHESAITKVEATLGKRIGDLEVVVSADGTKKLVAGFESKSSYEEWRLLDDADKWDKTGMTYVLTTFELPSADIDTYTVTLSMEATPAETQASADVSIGLRGVSSVVYGTGGSETIMEDLTIEVQTRNSPTGQWVQRGVQVIASNTEGFVPVSLKPYLSTGANYVRLRAVGEYASSVWRSFSVRVVSLSLAQNTALQVPFTGTLRLNYLIGGAVDKTLQIEFGSGSGSGFVASHSYQSQHPELNRHVGEATNVTTGITFDFTDQQLLSELLAGGVHTVRARLYYSDTVKTEWVESQYIAVSGGEQAACVNVNNVGKDLSNWTEVKFFDWSVYTAGAERMDVLFRLSNSADTETYATWNFQAQNNVLYHFESQLGIETEDSGARELYALMHIEDGDGNALADPVYYVIGNNASNQPTSGATLVIQPSGRNNNEAHPDRLINAADGSEVPSTFTGFGFKTDAWLSVLRDLDDHGANAETVRALRVLANRRIDAAYNAFFTLSTGDSTGKSVTFEIDFRTFNILDDKEPVLRIGGTGGDGRVWGFEMLPTEAYFLTQNMRSLDDQNVSWAEERRTHLAVNIVYGLYGGMNLCRIFLDGKIEREFIYESNDRFTGSDARMVIGSTSCDMDIFGLRVYEKALSTTEVMQDYKAALSSVKEKVTFASANDIVGDDGNISWQKSLGKYNVIGHTGHLPSYGDENKGKTKGVSLYINIVGDAAHSGTLTALESSGQGTTAMTYRDWNQQYKLSDDSLFIADDGTVSEPGSGYVLQTGEAAAKKLVGKINFASSMQSHKLGLTWIYNDLLKQLIANNVVSKPTQMAQSPESRVAVLEKPFLFFHRETEDAPWTFRYLMTFGAGKGDKPTFGFNKSTTPDYLMLEGANNDRPLALFRIPWNDDIVYDPDEEAFMYNGQKQLNFGFGATREVGGKEYPKSEAAIAAHKAFFNFAYLHHTGILSFEGTQTQLRQSDKVSTQRMYWVTEDDAATGTSRYDLMRWDELTSQWVAAGVDKKGIGQYEVLNLRAQYEAFCDELGVEPSVWVPGQWASIQSSICSMRRRHFHDRAGEFLHADDALYHACFVKLYAGTDNRAKNTYYYTDPGTLKIRFEQDDVDTTLKTNNVGQQRKPYYVEEHDCNESGEMYWQGEESGFYNVLEEAFESEMTLMMRQMLTAMAQMKGSVMAFHEHYLFSTQDYFPAAAYNEQARLVYESAAVAQKAGTYKNDSVQAITQSCGSQRWSEWQWIKDRIMYISSWCEYGEFAGNSSASNGMSWRGRGGATYAFTLTPAKWLYPRVGSDSGNYPASSNGRVRVAAGESIDYPPITLSSDSYISVRGIDYYLEIGDMNIGLSSQQGTFSFSGKRLQKITVNPGGMGENQFLATRVEVSNARNIKEFVLRGVDTVSGALDLTECTRLEKIDLRGSTPTQIGLAEGAPLQVMLLNGTLESLSLSHITTLSQLSLESVAKLTTLRLDHLGSYGRSIVEMCHDSDAPLTSMTLTGLEWRGVSRELLMWLAGLDYCAMSGSVTMTASAHLTLEDVLQLYRRYGDIQSESSALHIDYTKTAILHIGITGQKYFTQTGATQFGIATEEGNNVRFVGGKPALTWQFVKDEGGEETEDEDAADYIRLTDTTAGSAEVLRLNATGDKTRYCLKVTAELTTGETVDGYWHIGMFTRRPQRGDFAYADGSFDDELHMAKTVVGYAVRVTDNGASLTIDVAAKDNAVITNSNGELNTAFLPWGIYPDSGTSGIDETTRAAISQQSGGITLSGFNTSGSGTGDFATQEKTLQMTDRAQRIIRGWIASLWEGIDLTAPAFSEESTYRIGQSVTYDGTVYLCKEAVTEAGSFDLAHWSIVTASQKDLMERAYLAATEGRVPSNTKELGDMMVALRYLEGILGASTPSRFYQLFYPAAYACYLYVPAVRDGETLHEQYASHRWALPACGMVWRIYTMYHASRGKTSGGSVSTSYANEEQEGVADADYPLMANILKRLTDAGASVAKYPMWGNSHFWSSSEGDATSAWLVTFQNGGSYNNYKSYSYVVRAVTAFTYAIDA